MAIGEAREEEKEIWKKMRMSKPPMREKMTTWCMNKSHPIVEGVFLTLLVLYFLIIHWGQCLN